MPNVRSVVSIFGSAACTLFLALVVSIAAGRAAAIAHGEGADSGAVGAPAGASDAQSVGVDEGSGAATLAIPVDLPPGPNDHAPGLALSYSSQAQNGLLGVGWSIGSPKIVCSSRFGVPDYANCKRYELNGQVLVGPDSNDDSYHTFNESFSRIKKVGTPAVWEVTSTDGTTMRFGETAGSRVSATGGTAEWHLSSVTDVFGNEISYSYTTGPAGDTGHLYPDTISYAGGTRRVSFYYENRTDALSSYRGGVRRVQSQRLQEIRVEVNSPLQLHHRLWLEYETSSSSGLSRLMSIQRYGTNCGTSGPPVEGPTCSALPAAEFQYADTGDLSAAERWISQGTPAHQNDWWVHDRLTPGHDLLRGGNPQFADIDGDGLVDLVTDGPGRQDAPLLKLGGFTVGTGPQVFINDGDAGWKAPVWNGSDPMNDSAEWTDAINALRFDLPTHRIKTVESSYDPTTRTPKPQDLEVLFGTCRDALDPPQAVSWIDGGGSVQFSGVTQHDPAPHFDSTSHRNYPDAEYEERWCEDTWDEATQGPCPGPGGYIAPTYRAELWSEVATSEIRPWPHFQMVDLNADGRSDLVMSVHLSGFNLSLDDCTNRQIQAVSQDTWVEGATTTVVFMNTGDPNSDPDPEGNRGFWLDDARSSDDGNMADSLPPFGIVAFESPDIAFREIGANLNFANSEGAVVPSPCDDYGLAGSRPWVVSGGPYPGQSYDFCTAVYDLTPVFQDFDGDSYVDLMVTKTVDPDALFHNHRFELDAWGQGSEGPDYRKSSIESVVYLQKPEAGPGEPRWVHTPAYDPPYNHSLVVQLDRESSAAYGGVAAGEGGNAQTVNIDKGVRFADFNRDGLSDMLFSSGGLSESEFGGAGGVLLNRGAASASAARHSAWCASSAEPGVDLCVDDSSRYKAPFRFASFHHINDVNTTSGIQEVVHPFKEDIYVGDLNGDGWVDLLTADFDLTDPHSGQPAAGTSSRAFIHQPTSSGSVWVEDTRFEPTQEKPFNHLVTDPVGNVIEIDRSGYGFLDANGDGVLDLVSSEPWHADTKPSWISSDAAAQSDLLVGYRNGRGHRVELDYTSALSQRDDSMEAAAESQAIAPLGDGVTENDHLAEPADKSGLPVASEYAVHWTPGQLLAAIRVFSPELEVPAETSYRYAHPRRCHDHQEQLGFRLVETTRPDGSRVETYRFQEHGRVGSTSERIAYDELDKPIHYHAEEWEVADSASVPGAWLDGGLGAGVFNRSYVGRQTLSYSHNEYGATVGADPGLKTQTRTVYDDTHGYNFLAYAYADVPGRSTKTRFDPAPVDAANHLVDRVALIEVRANEGTDTRILSETTITYVDADSSDSFSKPGVVTKLVQDRDAPSSSSFMTTGFVYSSNGNLIEERAYDSTNGTPSGGYRSTHYCYDGDPGCLVGQNSQSMVVATQDALGRWSYAEPHSIFATTAHGSSEYRDSPTMRAEFDDLGRPIEQWHEPADGSAHVKMADYLYVDSPAGGRLFEGQPVSYRVVRQYAVAGDDPAVEAIAVSAGGSPLLSIALTRSGEGASALYTVTAQSTSSNPAARISKSSEPFACYPAPQSIATGTTAGYEAVIEACASVLDTEKSFVATDSDAMGRPTKIQTTLGVEVMAYSPISIAAGEFGAVVPHDMAFHKNANGGLKQTVMAAGSPVEMRDCNTPMDSSLVSLASATCDSPEISRLSYEPSGELRERTDPTVPAGGGSGPYAYGAEANQKLKYSYDTLGRIIEIDDPDAGVSTQAYDVWGDLDIVTDARGITVDTDYDALGRPDRVVVSGEAGETSFVYGGGTADPFLNATQVNDPNGVTWFGTDDLGRPKSQAAIVDGTYMRVRKSFDYLGRTTRIEYPNVFLGLVNEVRYEYDGGFLSRVCDAGEVDGGCDGTEAEPIVDAVLYDELGRLKVMELPGGDRTFTYDGHSGRRTSDHFASDVTTSDEDVEFDYIDAPGAGAAPAYDPLGNLTRMAAVIGGANFESVYAFDARNRIDSWTWTDGVNPAQFLDYDYDALGNLKTRADVVQTFGSATSAHAIQTRVEDGNTWSYSYDAAGNLSTRAHPGGGTTEFTFDGRGRLTCIGSVSQPCATLDVEYNGLGQRMRETRVNTYWYVGSDFRLRTKASDGARDAWIEFYAEGQRVGYKYVVGGNIAAVPLFPGWEVPTWIMTAGRVSRVVLALLVVAVLILVLLTTPTPVRGAVSFVLTVGVALFPIRVWAGGGGPGGGTYSGTEGFRWVMSDAIGSSLVEIDESGFVLTHTIPKPFGGFASGAPGGGGLGGRSYFAGHDRSVESGLVYMNARWMDPDTGTFVSVDPVVRSATTSQAFNGYAYVENNPISAVDPTGMSSEWRVVWTNPETGDKFSSKWQSGPAPAGANSTTTFSVGGVDAGSISFSATGAQTGVSANGANSSSAGPSSLLAVSDVSPQSHGDSGMQLVGRGNAGRGRRPNPRPKSSRFTPDPPPVYNSPGGATPSNPANPTQALIDGVATVAEKMAASGMLGAGAAANNFREKATALGVRALRGEFGDQGVWIVGDVLVGSAGELGAVFLPRTVSVIAVPHNGRDTTLPSMGGGVRLGPIFIPGRTSAGQGVSPMRSRERFLDSL